ncbi:3-deoxy-7-phosphoheptulonate synthase [Streptomyces monticola]|uniref:Phospho-2-dehydro-3-deoxyheptonate aldolase n=1 Tax=Streptomyces monticola TaxID=2666263 RepID=A0ABW2JD55_9ACTN
MQTTPEAIRPVARPAVRATAPRAAQQPDWPDRAQLRRVTERLRGLPGLVRPEDTARLRDRLAAAAHGRALLLQGGHCAETFGADALGQVPAVVATVRRTAGIIARGAALPVLPVGRMAGQYAKPRSRPTEVRDGYELPSYRGDAVNGTAFTAQDRTPDPWRMATAYHHSAQTLRTIAAQEPGQAGDEEPFHVSHEALLLDYERALVRADPATGRRYAASGHMLWIGERTRRPDGAHVAFAAGVENPVGVKIGPDATADELLALAGVLDPDRRPGRLVFITRMGADRIRHVLPELVSKVHASGSPALWVCDPMHGNTRVTDDGIKTRWVRDIAAEVQAFVEIHRELGTHPGGLHLELTGADVTECVGGSEPVRTADLDRNYTTACDPRLNRGQALDLAFLAAHLWGKGPGPGPRAGA